MSIEETQPHAAWVPYGIESVSFEVPVGVGYEPRTGFIGRGVAMIVDGIEVYLMARTVDDLAAAFGSITAKSLDETRIYRTTLIQSEGVEVTAIDRPDQDVFQAPDPDALDQPQLDLLTQAEADATFAEPTDEQHNAEVGTTDPLDAGDDPDQVALDTALQAANEQAGTDEDDEL